MALIRVIRGGCGVSYTDAKGTARFALKTPQSKPFECNDAHAARLVRKGLAVYVGEAPVDKAEGEKTEAELEKMTIDQLKNLAGDLGIDVSGCKKKVDYIAAIMADETEPGDEAEGDDLPDLSAADPE